MRFSTVSNVAIRGISAAVPTQWIPTDYYVEILGKDTVESFKKSSGVEGRCMAAKGQTAGDLCFAAAEKLLHEKNIDPQEVGVLVLVTQSGDYGDPATACVLQHRLNLSEDCFAFDVNLGCSGYSCGLGIAANLLSTSNVRFGLLLAGDTISWEPIAGDKREGINSSTLLLGDAGTATLLEKAADGESMTFAGETHGDGFRYVRNLHGGYRHNAPRGPQYMDDIEVFNFVMSCVPRGIQEFLQHTDTSEADYDCFALHQASLFTLKQLSKRLKISMDKIPLSLTKYGNASPASIPLSLVCGFGECEKAERVRTLMCGFGVGLSLSAASATLNTADILPLIKTDNRFDDGITEENEFQ